MLAAVTTHRPKWVWVIACWYGLGTIFGILGTAARYSEIQPMGDDPRTFVKTVYTVIPPDYLSTGVHLLDFIVMGAAAFLLFRLRKSAVEVCGITLALKVFVWLFPAIRGDFTRVGFHYIHTALIIGGVFFLMPPFVIFLYARKLREKGILT
jgi:hypothetical protein